jgi:hypothetical protein
MYKGAGRFLQALARKSGKGTGRRKRNPFQTALARRLDREVKTAVRAAEITQAKPALIKRRAPADPSK